MKRIIPTLAAAGLVLAISACSSGGDNPGTSSAPAMTSAAADPTMDAPTTDAPAPTTDAADPTADASASSDHAKFGDAVTFDDGLKLTISEGAEFTPSEYSLDLVDGWTALKYTVTIENGTDADFDPSMFLASAQSGTSEAPQIFDSANLGQPPTTTVLAGRSVSWDIGFYVSDAADVVMSVKPDLFEYDDVIFTS